MTQSRDTHQSPAAETNGFAEGTEFAEFAENAGNAEKAAAERSDESAVAASREREIASEQRIVELAYSELDRQLADAKRSLAATEAGGVGGTHQSAGRGTPTPRTTRA